MSYFFICFNGDFPIEDAGKTVLSFTMSGHSSPSRLVSASSSSSLSPFPVLSPSLLPLLSRGVSRNVPDSLFRSSFHVAFAFVKFFGRKTGREATVLGSRRAEKLWPCRDAPHCRLARVCLLIVDRIFLLIRVIETRKCLIIAVAGISYVQERKRKNRHEVVSE